MQSSSAVLQHSESRFSAAGLLLAIAAHAAAVALLLSAHVTPPQIQPAALMAQIIMAETPPAPEIVPPVPKPVVQPPTPREKPQPKPRPQPKPAPRPEPDLIAAPATSAAAAPIEVPVAKEPAPPPEPVRPAPPAPAAEPPIVQPRFDADYLHNPAPVYPPLSRRMREEGKVILRVFVEPDGRAGQVETRTTSGSARLDKAAEEAVWRWKFSPARRGDEAVGAWVLVPIVFSLRG